MSILISEALFPIEVKYVEIKLKNGYDGVIVIEDEEQEKKWGKEKIKTLHTQWTQPNWKESNSLIRDATVLDPFTGDRHVDLQTWQIMAMERYLKAWNIMDEKGTNVPCTPENIGKLDPNIAKLLMNKFMYRNTPTEEDLKN